MFAHGITNSGRGTEIETGISKARDALRNGSVIFRDRHLVIVDDDDESLVITIFG